MVDQMVLETQQWLNRTYQDKMNGFGTGFPSAGLLELAGDSTDKERQACC